MPSDFELLGDLLSRHREAAPLASLMLPPDGIAVVAGAYQGDTMAFLRTIYGPDLRLYGYEPQGWACVLLRERFKDDPNVEIREYGLGVEDLHNAPMSEYLTDGASFMGLPDSRHEGFGDLREVISAFEAEGLLRLDLLLLNMEGYEYPLLAHLWVKGWLGSFRNVLVQFHQNETMPYEDIRRLFNPYHELLWDDGPSWVCWRLREAHANADH